jgi:ABC-2 type transport system permease protein
VIALHVALWAEALKVRHSKIIWLSALAFALAPVVGALFMLILRDPDWARRTGLLSTKAQLIGGAADWSTYADMLRQAIAIGGLIIFSMIVIWTFGREYADSTITDLLALPVGRSRIVLAKFGVIFVWSVLLLVLVPLLGLILGTLLGLPGGSTALAQNTVGVVAVVGGMTVLLATPLACVASATRGYLPAVGALLLLAFLTQVLAALGWGPYFPWAIPALVAGVAGQENAAVGADSYLLVMVTGLVGVVLTMMWWRFADQK